MTTNFEPDSKLSALFAEYSRLMKEIDRHIYDRMAYRSAQELGADEVMSSRTPSSSTTTAHYSVDHDDLLKMCRAVGIPVSDTSKVGISTTIFFFAEQAAAGTVTVTTKTKND